MSQMPEAQSPESHEQPSSRPATGRSTKVDPLARRRLLLSGLGKGAAVVAATIPIKTLASSTLVCNGSSGKMGLCTVSGFQSAMHSFGAGSSMVQAAGWSTQNWGSEGFGTEGPYNPWPIPYNTLFKSIFGGTSTLTLFQMIKTNTPEAHWVAAYLNGLKFYPASFPYPAVTSGGVMGVREWYSSPQSAQALALFTRLETA